MRFFLLVLIIFNPILSLGQADKTGLAPPVKFTIYKPVNIQIKTRKDIAHLITDSLENPKAYILGLDEGLDMDSSRTVGVITQWSIAVEKNKKFYVFYPFEKSVISENGSEITAVRLKNIPIKQKGKLLIELSWESALGYGNTYAGGAYLSRGIQLWDFNTLTRLLDFLLMESSKNSSAGEVDYSCKEYEYEYSENHIRLIPDKICWGLQRRKVNDSTVCYNYQLRSRIFALHKVEPYIFYGEPAMVPNLPEYIRIIDCTSYDMEWLKDKDKSTVGFWYISSGIRVPQGKTELLLHRSGKTLALPEGTFTLAELNKLLKTIEPVRITGMDPYISPCNLNHRINLNPPFVFLSEGGQNYVYSKDSITLYTTARRNYQVYLDDYSAVQSSYTVNSDKIGVKIGQLKPNRPLEVKISLAGQKPIWSHEYVFGPLGTDDLRNFENGLKEYNQKIGDASEGFITISRAYFFAEYGLQAEALMLLRKLYEKDRNNQFNEAVYFSFVRMNYEFEPFEK